MPRQRLAAADGREDRCPSVRIGATAPNGVVVAKGDDDVPPHNALRFCHITLKVNGFALSPPQPAKGGPLR